jgi:hypothetical protein
LLPRYIDHFEENGALYLVMEQVEGESLAARRRRQAPLQQEQVLRFLTDAAACLRYLHGHAPPIVHRDIKPGNVLLRPDGSYCFVDFGSVRDRLKPEGGSTVVGTFGFMAPEQFQGRAAPVSDVYAVGATALSLITGREPEDLPHKGLGIDVEAALRGVVDRRLIAALRSMLEPDPDRRASSVDEALGAAGLVAGAGSVRPPSARFSSAAEAKAARRERLRERFSEIEDEQRERHATHSERHARKFAAVVERRARKQAEREARRAGRRFARDWHRPGPPVPPGIALGVLVLFALRIASVATFALFGVLLPLLFTLIYKPRTRQRMLEIGHTGQRGLALAGEHVRYRFMGGQIPPAFEQFLRDHHLDPDARQSSFAASEGSFGSSSPAPRRRVSVDAEAQELDDGEELDTEADARDGRTRP